MKWIKNKILLFFIICVSSILRLWNYSEIPYTHDEFSALFRTHFDTFSELIQKGIIIDGHPAGIQVFIFYWVKLFGYTEICVKISFIICGILSVFIFYKIAKLWYNETVALICASFLASIQYTIMYSQIARPYISGLFFSLLMVLFLTKIILQPQKKIYFNYFFYILSTTLCCYNHHFSLLFAFIVGVSAFFFLEKKYILRHILSGILIFLLYIPHIPIFLYQLRIGGVEGWLGKPKNDFIINYIKYIFQFSFLSFLITICISIFGLYKMKRNPKNLKFFILALCWFILPFLIGFFYSKYVNSVLQYSVLIFNFPFLFFLIFGHIKEQKFSVNAFLVFIILTTNILVLIFQRKHYEVFYNSPYEEVLIEHQKVKKWNKNVISIIDSDKKISNYYIRKDRINPDIIWYDSFASEKDFINFLSKKNDTINNLYFACHSESNAFLIPIIMDYFPNIVWQKNFAGANSYLFSKTKPKRTNLIEKLDFESTKSKWAALETSNYIDSICYSGKHAYLINSKSEWSPTYTYDLNKIATNKNNVIDISLKAYLPDSLNDIILVGILETKDSIFYWGGSPFNTFQLNTNNWISIHHSFKLSADFLKNKDIKLKTFVWNKGKHNFLIDDFKISLRKGNPILYGLIEGF